MCVLSCKSAVHTLGCRVIARTMALWFLLSLTFAAVSAERFDAFGL